MNIQYIDESSQIYQSITWSKSFKILVPPFIQVASRLVDDPSVAILSSPSVVVHVGDEIPQFPRPYVSPWFGWDVGGIFVSYSEMSFCKELKLFGWDQWYPRSCWKRFVLKVCINSKWWKEWKHQPKSRFDMLLRKAGAILRAMNMLCKYRRMKQMQQCILESLQNTTMWTMWIFSCAQFHSP